MKYQRNDNDLESVSSARHLGEEKLSERRNIVKSCQAENAEAERNISVKMLKRKPDLVREARQCEISLNTS